MISCFPSTFQALEVGLLRRHVKMFLFVNTNFDALCVYKTV